jgi:ketosteroid isomerase-like protein
MYKGDMAKYWGGILDAATVSIDVGTPTVEGRGDLAVVVGNYRLNVTPREAGAKPFPTEDGKYMQIMRKQADGSWKIAYDMWSSDAKP